MTYYMLQHFPNTYMHSRTSSCLTFTQEKGEFYVWMTGVYILLNPISIFSWEEPHSSMLKCMLCLYKDPVRSQASLIIRPRGKMLHLLPMFKRGKERLSLSPIRLPPTPDQHTLLGTPSCRSGCREKEEGGSTNHPPHKSSVPCQHPTGT